MPKSIHKKPRESFLNGRQDLFCSHYVKEFNGKQAAIAAGYTAKTAEVQASTLLRLPKVRIRIEELKRELSDKAAMSAENVIKELSLVAQTDIAEFMELDEDGNLRFKNFPNMKPGQSRCIKKIRQKKITRYAKDENGQPVRDDEVVIELELWDKLRALDLIGNYHSLWNQPVGVLDPRTAADSLTRIADVLEHQDGLLSGV